MQCKANQKTYTITYTRLKYSQPYYVECQTEKTFNDRLKRLKANKDIDTIQVNVYITKLDNQYYISEKDKPCKDFMATAECQNCRHVFNMADWEYCQQCAR